MADGPAAVASCTEPPRLLDTNVRTIVALERAAIAGRTWVERVADRVGAVMGSAAFAVFHIFWFAAWIIANVRVVPNVPAFDPFPFSFLTLVVSLEAIFLSILVLISQNRITRQADRRAHLLLQIALLAEQESTKTLALLRRIAGRLDVGTRAEPEVEELAEATNIGDVVDTLDRELPST